MWLPTPIEARVGRTLCSVASPGVLGALGLRTVGLDVFIRPTATHPDPGVMSVTTPSGARLRVNHPDSSTRPIVSARADLKDVVHLVLEDVGEVALCSRAECDAGQHLRPPDLWSRPRADAGRADGDLEYLPAVDPPQLGDEVVPWDVRAEPIPPAAAHRRSPARVGGIVHSKAVPEHGGCDNPAVAAGDAQAVTAGARAVGLYHDGVAIEMIGWHLMPLLKWIESD